MTTLVLVFKKKEGEDKTKYENFYSSSKAEIISSESDTDNVFKSTLCYNYRQHTKVFRKSGWIIDSAIDQILII